MKIKEIINEDISQASAIKNITDILSTELPELYHRLSKMAEEFEYNHGPIGEITNTFNNPKKFSFIMGSQKALWYKTVFETQLKRSLYALARTLTGNLRAELNAYTDEAISNGRFSQIEDSLIPLIAKIGASIKNAQLQAAAKAASSAMASYKSLVNKLWGSGEPIDGPEINVPKKPSVMGQQNSAAEQLINGVLADLDKKTAGEIRNAISRSGNRLQALQTELKKRGLAEGISRLYLIDK